MFLLYIQPVRKEEKKGGRGRREEERGGGGITKILMHIHNNARLGHISLYVLFIIKKKHKYYCGAFGAL